MEKNRQRFYSVPEDDCPVDGGGGLGGKGVLATKLPINNIATPRKDGGRGVEIETVECEEQPAESSLSRPTHPPSQPQRSHIVQVVEFFVQPDFML
jgi:hypothetical protein